jgi:hypothetical protein
VAVATKEAVFDTMAVDVKPDDLTEVIDARGTGALRTEGIVEIGVDTVAEKEAVFDTMAVDVNPDDLTKGIDAFGNGALKGALPAGGIVERSVMAARTAKEAMDDRMAVDVIPDYRAGVVMPLASVPSVPRGSSRVV